MAVQEIQVHGRKERMYILANLSTSQQTIEKLLMYFRYNNACIALWCVRK
jgi:hypothetical protein